MTTTSSDLVPLSPSPTPMSQNNGLKKKKTIRPRRRESSEIGPVIKKLKDKDPWALVDDVSKLSGYYSRVTTLQTPQSLPKKPTRCLDIGSDIATSSSNNGDLFKSLRSTIDVPGEKRKNEHK